MRETRADGKEESFARFSGGVFWPKHAEGQCIEAHQTCTHIAPIWRNLAAETLKRHE